MGHPPFFECTLKPWKWVPAIPVSTKYRPVTVALVQPPIPEPEGHRKALEGMREDDEIDEYDLGPKKEIQVMPATETWHTFGIQTKLKRTRGCWTEVKEYDVKNGTAKEEKN
jgi:hypothetical protein